MDAGILVPISLFAAIAFVSWVVIAGIRRLLVARLQASVQARLIDRFASAESLLAYTSTEAGREFVRSLLEERAERSSPYRSILNGVQAAILLTVFGIAVLLLHHAGTLPGEAFLVFGAIPLALGIGFALAAAATWLLSSRFGLLAPPRLS